MIPKLPAKKDLHEEAPLDLMEALIKAASQYDVQVAYYSGFEHPVSALANVGELLPFAQDLIGRLNTERPPVAEAQHFITVMNANAQAHRAQSSRHTVCEPLARLVVEKILKVKPDA